MNTMKYLSFLVILCSLFFKMSSAFAVVSPVIQHNVSILQNATPAQCRAAQQGRAAPTDVESYSGFGEYTGLSSPGMRSCSGCAVNSQSEDCVCKTCYYYFDG
jgi:hypothetical protein